MIKLTGLAAYTFVSVGQLLSMTCTVMSELALSIWAWDVTGNVTSLTTILLFNLIPQIILAPIVGIFVDRLPKKLTLIISDLGSIITTVLTLILVKNQNLEVWHLFLFAIWVGIFSTFQFPAFATLIPLIVSKENYVRANGITAFTRNTSTVLGPILAGFLLPIIELEGILLLDIITFCLAVSTLLLINIPNDDQLFQSDPSWSWLEITTGLRYMISQNHLRYLLIIIILISAIGSVGMVFMAPLILARTSGNELYLGQVMTALGLGGIVGGFGMSIWGGFKNRMYGVLLGIMAVSTLGYGFIALSPTPVGWLLGAFSITFFIPLLGSSLQAILQTTIPMGMQGRVFTLKQGIEDLISVVNLLLFGFLADNLKVPYFGHLFDGKSGNISLIFVVFGLIGFLMGCLGFLLPSVRLIGENNFSDA
jgi:hypothetical protein